MDDDGPGVGDGYGTVDAGDQPLLDLLDALVNDRGPTAAAEALGVNYRTVTRCRQSRRVTLRMRQVLEEFRDSQDVGDDGSGVGAGVEDGAGESPHDRTAELERENRNLRATVEAQAVELEALRRQVSELEERDQMPDEGHEVDDAQGQPEDWRPPRRSAGRPDAGVVTLEEQPDEAHAFGPAAPLVAEWREIRARMWNVSVVSRVDRAVAAVRRWELEAELMGEYDLTLPPETYPLDDGRRANHVRWRREALAEARRELGRAKRARLLRRAITLGLWRG